MDFFNEHPCNCEDKYTIEPHGNDYVLFMGRCPHKHGLNLCTISNVALICDLKDIENKLNNSFDGKNEFYSLKINDNEYTLILEDDPNVNLFTISEPAFNCELEEIIELLNNPIK